MDNPVFKLEGVVHERSAETLQDFEGPLDLILFLLSKNKIEIQDIPIALILDQYLAYLEQRKQLDLEVASEFITMAAHLMYIKTRMLLSLEDEQAQSEMDELMTRFKLLFRGSRSRSEIVATFIAVLELCREKVIHLAGSDTDCTVECGDDAPDRINL